MSGSPSRFISGIATVAKNKPLGDFPFPDPFNTAVVYQNDFQQLAGTEYTIAGGGALAISTTIAGGAVVFTPVSATLGTIYKAGQFMQFVAGQKLWYLARLQASAVAGVMAMQFGLENGATTTDGIWFQKAASQTAALALVSNPNGSGVQTLVANVLTAAGVAGVAAATWLDVGFYYDGKDLTVFVNDLIVARIANLTIGSTSAAQVTNAVITPSFQITPVATETLTIDYILAACEINR
jgi:hypothetical protein